MGTTLFIVHGVGPFDQAGVKQAVQDAAKGEPVASVTAFNWDRQVDRAFVPGTLNINAGVLSEISTGTLNTANLGFLESPAYAGLAPVWGRCLTAIALVFQLIAWVMLLTIFPLHWKNHSVRLMLFILLGALIFLSIIPGVFSGKPSAALACFRRIFLTFLWPFIHALAVPVGTGVVGMLLMGIGISYFDIFDRITFRPNATSLDYALTFTSYACILILWVAVTFWICRFIYQFAGPALKVFADMFRYLGIPQYRTRLLDGFAGEFATAVSGNTDVTIVSHSLGTVISVDALLRDPALTEHLDRLTLITMGSPLRRFLFRFFPKIYPSPEQLHGALAKQVKTLRWINIYRPLDYIGACLSPAGFAGIWERSTRQWTRSHTDYWSDRDVHQLVFTGLEVAPLLGPTSQFGSARPNHNFSVIYPGIGGWIWHRRDWLLRVAIWSTFAFFLHWLTTASLRARSFSWEALGIGVLGASGLWWMALWKPLLRPYILTLYGRLPIAYSKWQPASAPLPKAPNPTLKTWWPWVIPGALLVLLMILAYLKTQ